MADDEEDENYEHISDEGDVIHINQVAEEFDSDHDSDAEDGSEKSSISLNSQSDHEDDGEEDMDGDGEEGDIDVDDTLNSGSAEEAPQNTMKRHIELIEKQRTKRPATFKAAQVIGMNDEVDELDED